MGAAPAIASNAALTSAEYCLICTFRSWTGLVLIMLDTRIRVFRLVILHIMHGHGVGELSFLSFEFYNLFSNVYYAPDATHSSPLSLQIMGGKVNHGNGATKG